MAPSHNNPAIRRIRADVNELARNKSTQYKAVPCEGNIFEWHFAIRGPKGTDFEGGLYHGRIVLPVDYPFKPPSIIFLTPNGRWRTKEKICLSISNYHPEQWQPAWGIRTILEAIISFMTTPGEGAIGAIEVSPEERRRLARASRRYTHPLMPVIPEEEVPVEDNTIQTDDDKNDEKQDTETDPEKADNTSENEQTSATEPSQTTPENLSDTPPIDIVSSNSTQNTDSVDAILGNLSMFLLISIFAMLYKKALNLYA